MSSFTLYKGLYVLTPDPTGLGGQKLQFDLKYIADHLEALEAGSGGSTQAANKVLAGPASGSAAAPSYRLLTAADIPAIAITGVTGLQAALNGKMSVIASPTDGDILTADDFGRPVDSGIMLTDLQADIAAKADTSTVNALNTTLTAAIDAKVTKATVTTGRLLTTDGSGGIADSGIAGSNVALKNAANSFTAAQAIGSTLNVTGLTTLAALTMTGTLSAATTDAHFATVSAGSTITDYLSLTKENAGPFVITEKTGNETFGGSGGSDSTIWIRNVNGTGDGWLNDVTLDIGTLKTTGIQNTGNTQFVSGTSLLWSSSSTDPTATKDTGLVRSAAGVVRVTNGSTGFGDLSAKNFVMLQNTAATSTGSQQSSPSISLGMSLWNGSAAVLTAATIRSVASTSTNSEYRLALTAGTELMSLRSTGCVGISNTAPTAKLDIVTASQIGLNLKNAGSAASLKIVDGSDVQKFAVAQNGDVTTAGDVTITGQYNGLACSVGTVFAGTTCSDFFSLTKEQDGPYLISEATALEAFGGGSGDDSILWLRNVNESGDGWNNDVTLSLYHLTATRLSGRVQTDITDLSDHGVEVVCTDGTTGSPISVYNGDAAEAVFSVNKSGDVSASGLANIAGAMTVGKSLIIGQQVIAVGAGDTSAGNASNANNITINATGSFTMGTVSNPQDFQRITVRIANTSVSAITVTLSSFWKLDSGATTFTVGAGKIVYLEGFYHAARTAIHITTPPQSTGF